MFGGIATEFDAENTGTGNCLHLSTTTQVSRFTTKSTSGISIWASDNFEGVATNFYAEATTGDGIETRGTNQLYELRMSNFEVRVGQGVAIDDSHTNSYFSNYTASNESSTNSTITTNSNSTHSNSTVINYGSSYAINAGNNVDVSLNNMLFVSKLGIAARASLDNSAFSVEFNSCVFRSDFDSANGHAVTIDNSTGSINFSNCSFTVNNVGANCITASSSRTIAVGNSSFNVSTTPINANVTISLTTAPDSNGNYTN